MHSFVAVVQIDQFDYPPVALSGHAYTPAIRVPAVYSQSHEGVVPGHDRGVVVANESIVAIASASRGLHVPGERRVVVLTLTTRPNLRRRGLANLAFPTMEVSHV